MHVPSRLICILALAIAAGISTAASTEPDLTLATMLKAADTGDIATVTAALDAHPEWIDTPGYRWDSPAINYAAWSGHIEIVTLLIERGADIEAHHKTWKWRPIHEAADNGQIEIVKLLLAHGAQVNPRKHDGETPVTLAAANGYIDIVNLLIEHGVPVNDRCADGSTLLHFAAGNGKADMVKRLIHLGADISAVDDEGYTPLHWAATAPATRLLVEGGAPVNARGRKGRAPLHLAAMFGHDDVAKYLIDKGADVNALDSAGRSPLDLATNVRRDGTAKLLAALGGQAGKRQNTRIRPTVTAVGPKGQFILNGKPIIPFGVWQQPERLFSYNHWLGLDCLVFPPGIAPESVDRRRHYVTAAETEGLGAFVDFNENLADMPGVWGWSGGGHPASSARRHFEHIRTRDDSRVIVCNYTSKGLVKPKAEDEQFYRSVLPFIDCLVPHVWPEMFEDGPRDLRNVARMVDNARKFTSDRPGGEVSIWADINPHQWHKHGVWCQAPTVEEFRYQTWLALIHGADGICLFTISFEPFVFSQIPARMEKALPDLIAQVKQFTGPLTADESPRQITVEIDGEGIIDYATRRFHGDDYVFVVNGPEKAGTIRISSPGLGQTADLYNAIAGNQADSKKPLTVTDGAYAEKVPPLGLKIWKISPRKAE